MTNELKTKAIEWFKSLYKENFIIVDTETTGLNTKSDEIIEIGVLSKEGKEIFKSRIKPTGKISTGAIRTHGISEKDLIESPKFSEIYNDLKRVISNNNFVGYSAYFDYEILNNNCEMHNLEKIKISEVFDVMGMYADYWGEYNPTYDNCKWQKLTVACKQQDIKIENSHASIGDCKLTLELIKKISNVIIEW